MPKSKMSKLLRSLLPRSASPCVYDAGLDDCENICEFLDDAHKVAGAGDGAGIIRAEQLSDGTLLLRVRRPSQGSGGVAPQTRSITLSNVGYHTHSVHAPLAPSRSLQPSRSLKPPATGLQRDRSIADSERHTLSSTTPNSTELSGLFCRSNSIREHRS